MIVEVESARGLLGTHTHDQLAAFASAPEKLILAVPHGSRSEAEALFGNIAKVTSTPWETTAVAGYRGLLPYAFTAANIHPWILNALGVAGLYSFLRRENSRDEQQLLTVAEEQGVEELAMLAILELEAEKQTRRDSRIARLKEVLPFSDWAESVEIGIIVEDDQPASAEV